MQIIEFDPADAHVRVALGALDTSFETATILDVRCGPAGFDFTERTLDRPVTKRYPRFDEADPDSAAQPAPTRFVAIDAGKLLGVATTTFRRWNHRQDLTDLLVDRPARRRGVARSLVEQVLATAAANGARECWLETQHVNLPAIKAYQALGFTITGCDTTLYDGALASEVAIFMSRPL